MLYPEQEDIDRLLGVQAGPYRFVEFAVTKDRLAAIVDPDSREQVVILVYALNTSDPSRDRLLTLSQHIVVGMDEASYHIISHFIFAYKLYAIIIFNGPMLDLTDQKLSNR